MPDAIITRRTILKGAGAAALTFSSGAKASVADFGSFAERRLTIFRDYAGWMLMQDMPEDCLRASQPDARVLCISDLAPSCFAQLPDILLLRPAVLERLPASELASMLARTGSLVLSASSGGNAGRDRQEGRPALWRSLARLMAIRETSGDVCLDLGASLGDDDTIRSGIDLFRQTYAARATDRIAVHCPQGPRLLFG